jgi:hypothetical protein
MGANSSPLARNSRSQLCHPGRKHKTLWNPLHFRWSLTHLAATHAPMLVALGYRQKSPPFRNLGEVTMGMGQGKPAFLARKRRKCVQRKARLGPERRRRTFSLASVQDPQRRSGGF